MTTDIPLTRDLVARVDDADLPALLPFKWHATADGYAATRLPGTRRYVYMHRLLLNAGPDDLVDHIDGDRLNNTRANLRLVTPCQNQWNRKAQANRSGYKGVAWHKQKGKYYARIQANGRRIFLGYFATAEAAARAYEDAARELFGEYAPLVLMAD